MIYPTLIETPTQTARMMDRGTFDLFHAWDMGDGFTLEYWRGTDNNGACLRTLHDGRAVSITHYAKPGAAINVLRIGRYPVPGVAPIEDATDRDAACAANWRTLRASEVTCLRP